jgi:hypothetical protein
MTSKVFWKPEAGWIHKFIDIEIGNKVTIKEGLPKGSKHCFESNEISNIKVSKNGKHFILHEEFKTGKVTIERVA